MTTTASLFISVIITSFLLWMMQLIKRRKLAIRYALYWMILSIVLFVISWFPGILAIVANLLGIRSEMNLVFFIGFCLSLWIIFWLTNTVSLQASKIKRLTQQLALLEKKVGKYDETSKS